MTTPRVLVVDDDAVARQYLAGLLQALDVAADLVAGAAQGLALARARRYDLLVVDRRLDHGDAAAWLRSLREDASAASRASTAIAHSAELAPADRARLLAAGFAATFEKPLPPAALAVLLQAGSAPSAGLPAGAEPDRVREAAPFAILDDAAGIEACGSRDILDGLRQVLRDEIPQYRRGWALAVASADFAALGDLAHRMRAAARFCGAPDLLAALARGVDQRSPDPACAWQAVDAALEALAAALRESGG